MLTFAFNLRYPKVTQIMEWAGHITWTNTKKLATRKTGQH